MSGGSQNKHISEADSHFSKITAIAYLRRLGIKVTEYFWYFSGDLALFITMGHGYNIDIMLNVREHGWDSEVHRTSDAGGGMEESPTGIQRMKYFVGGGRMFPPLGRIRQTRGSRHNHTIQACCPWST